MWMIAVHKWARMVEEMEKTRMIPERLAEMEKSDLLARLVEIKELVTESGINPTIIGEIRMLLWLAEKELDSIEIERGGGTG